MAAQLLSKLLGTVAALASPVEDLDDVASKRAERCGKEVRRMLEMAKEEPVTVRKDVVDLLLEAEQLVKPEQGSIPLARATAAIVVLSQASGVLSRQLYPPTSPLPLLPSSLQTRMPQELLEHIFDYAQDEEDLGARQRLNLGLSTLCHSFHRAIRPRLVSELHITRASQLSRAILLDHDRLQSLDFVSMDFVVEELAWEEDGPWHGEHLAPLLAMLPPLDRFDLRIDHLRSSTRRVDLIEGLREATGMEVSIDFNPFPPNRWHEPPRIDGCHIAHDYYTLAVPFFIIVPQTLSTLLPPSHSTLHRLEVTLVLGSSREDTANFQTLFDLLAPTLKHLVLRVNAQGFTDYAEPYIVKAIQGCSKLETLAVGGRGLHDVLPACLSGSLVADITFLPVYTDMEGEETMCELHGEITQILEDGGFKNLRTATVFVKSEGGRAVDLDLLVRLKWETASRGIKLVARRVPEEWALRD